MKCLLIDFGASYIKTAIYDTTTQIYSEQKSVSSPFLIKNEITKEELKTLLKTIIEEHPSTEAVFPCTILGGFYVDDAYYSWKTKVQPKKNFCLLSGLFSSSPTFHIHEHHREFTDVAEYESKLRILGYIGTVPVYSSLGDTYCVINSVLVDHGTVGINLGTGSQMFYKDNEKLIIKMYIPSGRTFLMFDKFFNEVNLDFFEVINTLTVHDVLQSTLDINLNVFPQAHRYNGVGGSISNIMEDTFTFKNLLSSIIRNYVQQYVEMLPKEKSQIHLLGGMAEKLPILSDLFKFYCPDMKVTVNTSDINNTHMGIINTIKTNL